MSTLAEWIVVTCPYCGAAFETRVDCSAPGPRVEYVEDCQVCCSPILFIVELSPDGSLHAVETRREND
ncbi:MAG TPA: CPXCG motif-containing cysteine-rich protein [Candidatus Competibacteraceae bacterium]|nr:CPXCG motif-containing cysteine-rich protein [Candidatus Competibacteraceae bacterium]